jgi:predicted enzyme related to lactoylglutathione lyase
MWQASEGSFEAATVARPAMGRRNDGCSLFPAWSALPLEVASGISQDPGVHIGVLLDNDTVPWYHQNIRSARELQGTHVQEGDTIVKHTFVHFEIPADDLQRASTFYTRLFDWSIEPAEGFEDYWFVQPGEAEEDLGGALMPRQDAGQSPVFYIQVESVADYAARVEELEGQVVVPKTPVPGMGWWAHFRDPEGNLFALWETDDTAA